MLSCGGGWSAAQYSLLPSSLHHPEHEHFFNHSRESQVELSGGRVSHRSVCSHHAFPPPLDIPMPRISLSPALQASTSPPFLSLCTPFHSHAKFFSTLVFTSLSAPPHLKFYFYLCHNVICPLHCRTTPSPAPPALLPLDGLRLCLLRDC